MRYLHLTSYGIAVAGIVTLVAAVVLDFNAAVQLTALMLAIAGVVKIVVVHLWTHVAHLGSDRHEPIPPA